MSLCVSSAGGAPEEQSGQTDGISCPSAQQYMQGTLMESLYRVMLYDAVLPELLNVFFKLA